ncbi:MAG: helix-turn-helix domain-containing protein [Nitrososphaerota archaeon]
MLLPAEIESKLTIPMLRALVARRLVKVHKYTQEEVAKALGLTQAAVSNYLRGVRGWTIDWEANENVRNGVDEVVSAILEKKSGQEVARKFNEVVLQIRKTRILCEMHKKVEPDYEVDSCHVCE